MEPRVLILTFPPPCDVWRSCEMLRWILDALLNSATYGKHMRGVAKAQSIVKTEREEVAERWSRSVHQQVSSHLVWMRRALTCTVGVAGKKPSLCYFNSVGISSLFPLSEVFQNNYFWPSRFFFSSSLDTTKHPAMLTEQVEASELHKTFGCRRMSTGSSFLFIHAYRKQRLTKWTDRHFFFWTHQDTVGT